MAKITFEGKTYTLVQPAYVGADGRYYAAAVDDNGNEYRITWETTDAWKEAQERLRETGEAGITVDESHACDWGNPVKVERIS